MIPPDSVGISGGMRSTGFQLDSIWTPPGVHKNPGGVHSINPELSRDILDIKRDSFSHLFLMLCSAPLTPFLR